MIFPRAMVCLFVAFAIQTFASAQQPICQTGQWQQDVPANTILLDPLREKIFIESSQMEVSADLEDKDRFKQVIRATVRVTARGGCGSGTIVGRDSQGNAIVLTNAHVAGTTRGRTVNVERWDSDGTSEKGRATIIAAGYGRGMSVDFALLKCNKEFAQDVTPIPLADRQPDTSVPVTNFGCPRCEWPSLQVLKMNRSEGQVLTWKPEAIGGRSGSSVIDHTDAGPRVVGLLTWGGGGEGLGQSTPFLLSAMRGKLPISIESLPANVREVSVQDDESFPQTEVSIYQVPATTAGQPLELPVEMVQRSSQIKDDLIDSITEEEIVEPEPEPEDIKENGLRDRDRDRQPGPIGRGLAWVRRLLVTMALCVASGVIGFFVGRFWK